MDVVDFWFKHPQYWFNPEHEKVDTIIKNKFGTSLYDHIIHQKHLNNIIVLDQFSRHIHRGDDEKIKKFTQLAAVISKYCIKLDYDLELPLEHRCFMLMPLRHNKESHVCLERFLTYENWKENSFAVRFYKATLMHYENEIVLSRTEKKIFDFKHICDYYDEPSFKKIKSFIHDFKDNKICVSLSGGVDSMVCLYSLHMAGYKNISAIHINYMNRDTAIEEEEFCSAFCQTLGVPLYVRRIKEIQRTRDAFREFYETCTKNIRFKCYKSMDCDFILLGHNQDDCVENMFSNISKQRNMDNLFGMEAVHEEKGVDIWRPILGVSKTEIIKFARDNGVPYLYDSTNDWCERGKMRDQLVPFLNNFNKLLIPGMCKLVEEFSSQRKMIDYEIYKNITWEDDYVKVPKYLHINHDVIIKIAIHLKVKYPRRKATSAFLENPKKMHLSKNLDVFVDDYFTFKGT